MEGFRNLRLRKRIVFAIGVFLGFLILVGILNYAFYRNYNSKSSSFFHEAVDITKSEHALLDKYQNLIQHYESLVGIAMAVSDTLSHPGDEVISPILKDISGLSNINTAQSDSLCALVRMFKSEADYAVLLLKKGEQLQAQTTLSQAKASYGDRFTRYLTQLIQESQNSYSQDLKQIEEKRKQLIILILLALIGLFAASLFVYLYYMQNISKLKYLNELQSSVQRLSTLLTQKLLNQQETQQYDQALLDFMVENTEASSAAVFSLEEESQQYTLRSERDFLSGEETNKMILANEEAVSLLKNNKGILYVVSYNKTIRKATRSDADMIIIPVLQRGVIVSVLVLSFRQVASEKTERFLKEMWSMIMVGYSRVSAYEKVIRYGEKVDDQNRELEKKTRELTLQSEELKESNVELQMQKMQLDEANQMKTKFLSNMSHELRTPLNSIIALTGVLSRKLNGIIKEKDINYLEVILRNGKHLLSLINEVLDLARIEAGKMEINREEFSLIGLVDTVLETVEPLARSKSIALKRTFDNGDVKMFSDRAKCYHIIQNIISNAVKFTNKGYVEVSLDSDNRYGYISITDTGVGIPEENLPHIFDEFHQVYANAINEYEGTGLGLSIAHKYCNLLNGDIVVKSNLDEGTEFLVKIPLTEKQYDDKLHSYTRTWFGEAKSVVLIELVPDESNFVKKELDRLKIPVVVARSFEKASEILCSIVPECIILDGQNSKRDEIELLKQLRMTMSSSHTPVLILTDNHFDDSELSELKSRKNAFVISHASVLSGGLKSSLDRLLYSDSHLNVKNVQRAVLNTETTKGRILIIEDNTESLRKMEDNLAKSHIVYSARDGLLGAEKARMLSPDIILMDITLPGKDGIVLMKELKQDKETKDTPIIALTTKALRDEREELMGYGFDDYIAKPVDNTLLNTTINNWLYGE